MAQTKQATAPTAFHYPDSVWVNNKPTASLTQDTNATFCHNLKFDATIGEAYIDSSELDISSKLVLTSLDALTSKIPILKSSLFIHSMLSRLEYAHPSKEGFIPRALVKGGLKSNLIEHLSGGYADRLLKYTFSRLLPKEWDGNFGWFDPEVDSGQNGAQYLAPYSEWLSVRKGTRKGPVDIATQQYFWGLFQVGFSAPLSHTAWNDLDGIRNLIAQARTKDVEPNMVVRVLSSDPDVLQKSIEINKRRLAFDAAREAFKNPKNRVKIRAIDDAIAEIQKTLNDRSGFRSHFSTTEHSLNSYDIYRGADTTPTTIQAAREIGIDPTKPLNEQLILIEKIANRIKAENLGHVIVNNEPAAFALFIVANPALFLEHRSVFFGSHIRQPYWHSNTSRVDVPVSDGSKLVSIEDFFELHPITRPLKMYK